MPKIAAIGFSKCRPLQLKAFLESALYYTDGIDKTTIILDSDIHYKKIIESNKDIDFVVEKDGFNNTLRRVISEYTKEYTHILFFVDDVIWFNHVYIPKAANFLDQYDTCLGFSFRLGTNIIGAGKISAGLVDENLVWSWANKFSHWGYPGSVTSDLYRSDIINDLVNYSKDPFNSPNDLEGRFVNLIYKGIINKPYCAMFNSTSRCAALDINVVNTSYNNRHQGTEHTTPEKLLEAYYQGYRIPWGEYSEMAPKDCFIGSAFRGLIK